MSADRISQLRALVVDDEEDLARLVADYLASDGFATQVAFDGERALELARADAPDVVVLDLMLPGIDGIEVCRRLRTFSDSYVINADRAGRGSGQAHRTCGRRGRLPDPAAREVHVAGRPVELTKLEFDLLDALSARPRLAFTRRQLVDRVWRQDWFGDDHIVDVHVVRLRRKLGDDPARPRYVLTVRGVGYRMGSGT
jgi:DNA-binding response OmpR family regulator